MPIALENYIDSPKESEILSLATKIINYLQNNMLAYNEEELRNLFDKSKNPHSPSELFSQTLKFVLSTKNIIDKRSYNEKWYYAAVSNYGKMPSKDRD